MTDRPSAQPPSEKSKTALGEPARLVRGALTALAEWLARYLPEQPQPDEIEALEELFPRGAEAKEFFRRFLWLIGLSASIAAFGLLADSSAVVIGAMLVAPLMTPINGVAAALVTARNRRLANSAGLIVAGTLLAIVVGWIVGEIAGRGSISETQVPQQVLDRTFPGLLDLGIAVTAGAASGYILPRKSATGALPGVGIAVALVPPLATVGITLSAGLGELARNALLLFLTNLAAIVFAVSIMLLLAGFRPHSGAGRRGLSTRLALTLAAVIVIAVPLTLHTTQTIDENELRGNVAAAVRAWGPDVRVLELDAQLAGGLAKVDLLVVGQDETKRAWRLAEEIRDRFGGPVELRLRYQVVDELVVSGR